MFGLDPETFENYIDLAGLAATVIGFIFIIVQVRQLGRSVRSSAQSAIYDQAADFREHLVAYPQLRPFFFDGADIDPAHPEYNRALTIAELFLNYLEHIAIQGGNFDGNDRKAWESFVRAALTASPLMSRRLAERPDAYSPQLRRLA
ncbi:hypothetical protein [Hyphococcus sp.]|uniref:hypothetical protein n=1 Tax=Hyphococcus sp. TaxID=2038636 RepID=UPI0035C70C5A